MFQQSKLRFLAVTDSASTLKILKQVCQDSSNANLRLAYATAVHNYGVYYGSYHQPNEAKEIILGIIKEAVPNETDPNIVYRYLCGAGTLIGENGEVVSQAKKMGLQEVVRQKISSPNAKIAGCAFQVLNLLR